MTFAAGDTVRVDDRYIMIGRHSAARPGRAAFTSFQLSSAGSLSKLSGSLPAGAHGPFSSAAFSHVPSLRR